MAGTDRNQPCPCGSGKKYKKCCLGRSSARYSAEERALALAALEDFITGPGWEEAEELAEAEFWDDLDPDATAAADNDVVAQISEQIFNWWFFFDYELEPRVRPVDTFLATHPDLPAGSYTFLKLARETALRVYEVKEVRPGSGLTLRDVVHGTQTRVRERLGSQSAHRWDVFCTRIVPAGTAGEPVLDGGMLPIAPLRREAIIRTLKEDLAELKHADPRASEAQYFAEILPELHRAWIEPAPMPTLVNYDGDPMLFARVRFRVLDRERLVEALDGAKALARGDAQEGAEPCWHWSGPGKERREPVLLGRLALRGEHLELETNSAERAERGKKLVERLAGSAVQYLVTSTQDPEQAMRRVAAAGGAEPEEPEGELREVAHAAAEQHLTERYEQWLDEPVPRLDDITPREAARSGALRPRVVEMLKELEGLYEKALADGKAAFDPSWMWQVLDLEGSRVAAGADERVPELGHLSLERHLPGLGQVAMQIAERIRGLPHGTRVDRIVDRAEVERDLSFQRLARESDDPELTLCCTELSSNFELHLRKVFWVQEALAWMLGATRLDVTGSAVRPPFASFALVFTDRYALGLAERMLSRLPEGQRQGRMLSVLTAYVTADSVDGSDAAPRRLVVRFVCDALDGTCPRVVPCEMVLDAERRVEEALRSLAALADEDGVLPLYESVPLRDLLSLVVNAVLYATSADANVQERPYSAPRNKGRRREDPTMNPETVFYLPGAIDIGALRRVQQARRGGREHELTRRCMVRGHWRSAPKSWKAQRARWIKPHWRGPSAAAIVEKQYRLRE